MRELNNKDSKNRDDIGYETHANWIQTTITIYFKPNTIYEHVTTNRDFHNRRDVNEDVIEDIFS